MANEVDANDAIDFFLSLVADKEREISVLKFQLAVANRDANQEVDVEDGGDTVQTGSGQ